MTTTIRQTVRIPSNHQLNLMLDLPEDVPAGQAEMLVTISPLPAKSGKEGVLSLAGALAESRAFAGDPLEIQRRLRDEW